MESPLYGRLSISFTFPSALSSSSNRVLLKVSILGMESPPPLLPLLSCVTLILDEAKVRASIRVYVCAKER